MFEEVFGPVLPLVRVSSYDDFVSVYKKHYQGQKKPLSSYIFTKNWQLIKQF